MSPSAYVLNDFYFDFEIMEDSNSKTDSLPETPPDPTSDELLHQYDGKDMDLLLKV